MPHPTLLREAAPPVTSRNALRKRIRQQRAALTPQTLASNSLRASARLTALPTYRRAKRIGAYIALGGEMDPTPVLMDALAQGKRVYLPKLHPFLKGRMWFIEWQPGDPLVRNRFGIPEPIPNGRKRLPNWLLQFVLVPLVAFDDDMNRLGMGQGFYDRAFAFTKRPGCTRVPFLCGFAHALQQADSLTSQAWDVSLDSVVTESCVHSSRNKS